MDIAHKLTTGAVQLALAELRELGFPVVDISSMDQNVMVKAYGTVDGRDTVVSGTAQGTLLIPALNKALTEARNVSREMSRESAMQRKEFRHPTGRRVQGVASQRIA